MEGNVDIGISGSDMLEEAMTFVCRQYAVVFAEVHWNKLQRREAGKLNFHSPIRIPCLTSDLHIWLFWRASLHPSLLLCVAPSNIQHGNKCVVFAVMSTSFFFISAWIFHETIVPFVLSWMFFAISFSRRSLLCPQTDSFFVWLRLEAGYVDDELPIEVAKLACKYCILGFWELDFVACRWCWSWELENVSFACKRQCSFVKLGPRKKNHCFCWFCPYGKQSKKH